MQNKFFGCVLLVIRLFGFQFNDANYDYTNTNTTSRVQAAGIYLKTLSMAVDTQKLKDLAVHLAAGRLGHYYFDFGNMNAGPFIGYGGDFRLCKAAGDALGELPFVTKMWVFDEATDAPVFIYLEETAFRETGLLEESLTVQGAAAYFNIKKEEVMHLFFPFYQKPEKYGGKPLTNNATKFEVADNIHEFIKKVSNGKH